MRRKSENGPESTRDPAKSIRGLVSLFAGEFSQGRVMTMVQIEVHSEARGLPAEQPLPVMGRDSQYTVALIATQDASRQGGAITPRFMGLARLVKRAGAHVSIHVSAPRERSEKTPDGIPIHWHPTPSGWRNPIRIGGRENPIGVAAAILDRQPDLVLVEGVGAAPLALLLGASGLPVIMDVPVLPEDAARDRRISVRQMLWLKSTAHLACREPEGVLVPSHAVRNLILRRHGAHAGRVMVVPDLATTLPVDADSRLGLTWVAPVNPASARFSLRRVYRQALLPIHQSLPEVPLRVVVPSALADIHLKGVQVTSGITAMSEALGRSAVVLRWGESDTHAMSVAAQMGLPICGFPGDAVLADHGREGIAIGISPKEVLDHVYDLLQNPQKAAELGEAGACAWAEHHWDLDGAEMLQDVMRRARKAWLDPEQKLRVLETLPGRWPKSPNQIRRFLGA